MSLVDLYVGFLLFCGWIVFRERSAAGALIWVAQAMVLGFFAANLYTLVALRRSDGD